MVPVIEIEGLHKSYRRFRKPPAVALDDLDLVVPEGGVFGFLGPNGSGKTTTIRCVLGLARPTAGAIALFGRPLPEALPTVMRSIGAVVENASFLAHMTGREQVRLLAKIDGIPAADADRRLEAVGLGDRGGDAVKGYSLGMRQRLALAVALLKDPALLVLDEPANGLDPAGMREIRDLVRRLGREGRTVFVSSHLLSEVEQMCDRVAILNNGRCVMTAAVAELVAGPSVEWLVRVAECDLVAAGAALSGAGLSAEAAGPHLRVVSADGRTISRVLGEAGVWLAELRQAEARLEDLFLALTGPAPVVPEMEVA